MALSEGRKLEYLRLFEEAEANQDIQALNNLKQMYHGEIGAATTAIAPPAVTGQQAFAQSSAPPEMTPQTNWFENVADAAKIGWQNIGPAVASGVTGVADILGYDDWADQKRRERSMYDQTVREYGTFADDISPGYDPGRIVVDMPGEMFDLKSSGVESIAGTAPLFPVGILGSVLAPAGAVAGTIGAGVAIFSTMFPAFFDEAKKEGFDDARALEQGLFRAAAEAGPEALWITRIFSRVPGMKNLLGNALDVAGTQGATEVVTEGFNMLYDMWRKGEDITSKEAAYRLAQAFTVGTAGGLAMGTPLLAAQTGMEAMTPATPQFTGQIAQQEMDARQGLLPEQKAVFADREAALADAAMREGAGLEPGLAARTTEATRGYYDPSIQRASVFVQEIYDSLANDPNTGEPVRRPSKREIQQAVREVVAEEVDDHFTFLNMLEDKEGFLTKYNNVNKTAIEEWRASPEGEIYADYDPLRAVAEYISHIARTSNVRSTRLRSLIASIKLYLRKKGVLGFDADFSDKHILDLLTKAAAQARRGTPGAAPTVGATGLFESKVRQFPDRMKEVATERAMAPNEDVRFSDQRMQSLQEDWANNELDLRREYRDFDTFEEAEWDLNYEMWLDELPTAILESRQEGPEDPSRREFLKRTGAAAAATAIDPSILLAPATEQAATVEAPLSLAPDVSTIYKFDITVDPDIGRFSGDDPGERSMEVVFDYNPHDEIIEIYEEDELVDTINTAESQEDVDAFVIQYVNDEYGRLNVDSVHDPIRDPEDEMGDDGGPLTESERDAFFADIDSDYKRQARIMVTGQLESKLEPGQRENFARMVEEGGVQIPERGPAYDFLKEPDTVEELPTPPRAIESPAEPKALPAPEETVQEEVDILDITDDILIIYDDLTEMREAAQDGSMNERILMFVDRTNIPREELWDAVNKRMDSLDDGDIQEARVRKPKSETLMRDINDRAKRTRIAINKADITDEQKAERLELLKRLRGVMGGPARKRGIDAGNQDVFYEQADNIVNGNLESVDNFIIQFEPKLTGTEETQFKRKARREQRAKRLGKTDAEILKYRPKGTRHPMETKMTYPFAQEEINRLEKEGEITAEEAEIRRLAVNNVRRVYAGKAGPTVKRIITEAAYGIGNYEALVPWGDVYTEEQVDTMEERATVAAAEARRTRYDPTDITAQQKRDILKAPVTAEERAWIESEEMPTLKGKRNRLLFLRAPAEFKSVTEEKELAAFRAALKEKKPYVQEPTANKEELLKAAKKEGRYTLLPATGVIAFKESQPSRVINVDPIAMERMGPTDDVGIETDFQYADTEYTEQGEAIDPDWFQWTDDDGNAVEVPDKILEARGKLYQSDKDTDQTIPPELQSVFGEDNVIKITRDGTAHYITPAAFKELGEKRTNRFGDQQRLSIKNLGEEHRKAWADVEQRDADIKASKEIKDITKKLTNVFSKYDIKFSPDHIVPYRKYGLDYAWNIVPIPSAINLALGDKLAGSVINDDTATGRFFNSLFNSDNKDILTSIVKATAAAYPDKKITDNEGQVQKDILDKLVGVTIPEPAIAPKSLKQSRGTQRIINTYNYPFIAGETPPFIPRIGKKEVLEKLPEWQARLIDPYFLESRAGKEHFMLDSRRMKGKGKDYYEHFNDGFWYRLTGYLWGKPVQSIRDFNKVKRFGTTQGDIRAADEIADLIQRAHSVSRRAPSQRYGPDMMQDVSMRSGEYYSQLSKIFAMVTDRGGIINKKPNDQIVNYLLGRDVKFSNKKIKQAAEDLKSLVESVYGYAKKETEGMGAKFAKRFGKPADISVLDLRGEGDSLLPRVWNIEYMATRAGKAKFLRVVSDILSPPEGTTPIFEDADITVEDLYDTVINSGGFVQGEWTNLKADQLRSEKDIQKDLKVQEYLDGIPTESLIDDNLILDDLQAVIPRFIQKAIERTEYSKRFGKNDEILRALMKEGIDQIRKHNREVLKLKPGSEPMPYINEKRFEKAVWDMAKILRNKYGYDMANMSTRKWLQRGSNMATIMKLPLVTLASLPEFFTPMLKGDVSPHRWFMDLMAGTAWAGYKGMSGMSKLLFNKHLPAMRKYSKDIGGLGIVSDVQLLRELGIADIQAMGDLVSTRYANPNFARGGLRAGSGGSIAGKVPKHVRGAFNMQTFMQATFLTTLTEMQQLMALRNFQRHMGRRVKFIQKNRDKKLSGRKARLFKQFSQDLEDYGLVPSTVELDTASGQAEFNAGALRFIDQVITRPNDATTAKAFKNPLTAPLVLFKRFITTYGNTLVTSVGSDFATKVDNVERAKQVGKVAAAAMGMYGMVMFAEIMRGAIKGDLDEDDFEVAPKDFQQFIRRLDRTGLLTAPGTAAVNLTFPYKRGWWDTTQGRIMGELTGPLGGDVTAFGDAMLSDKNNAWGRFVGQMIPLSKGIMEDRSGRQRRITSQSAHRVRSRKRKKD